MTEPVTVRARDCACPGTPHDEGDLVYLAPTLSLLGGLAAQRDWKACLTIAEDGTVGIDGDALTDRWLVTFVKHGYTGSNFGASVDDILADFTIAEAVADRASDLYQEAVLRPLGLRRPMTSPPGPTDDSTSPTPASTTLPPE